MKPNFALNVTDDAIGLLHRTARGWIEIGQTTFAAPDLDDALGYLRASALGLSPQGVTTKIVIPNSQILYLEVDAPGPDAAARKAQIRAALDGRTPYGVDDLVFDWWGKGPRVQVAVIARETLQEAEAFAVTHRFNPVSFVAIPPAGRFTGEPFFGPTEAAARLLAPGDQVTRDQDPIQIVARDLPRAEPAKPEAEAAKAPAEARAETPKAAPEVKAEAPKAAAAEVKAEAPKAATAAEAKPEAPKAAAAAEAKPEAPKAAIAAEVKPDASKAAAAAEVKPEAAKAPTAAEVKPEAPKAAASAEVKPDAPKAAAAAEAKAEAPKPAAAETKPDTPKAAAPGPEARPDPGARVAPPVTPVVTAAGLREPAPAAPSFSSRRRDETAAPPALGPAQGRTPAAPPVTAARPADARPADRSAPPPVTAATPPAAPVAAPAAPAPAAAPRAEVKPVAKPPAPPRSGSGGIDRPVPKPAQPLAALAAAATTGARRPADRPATTQGRGAAPDPLAKGRGAPVRGKPRYLGLVLTGVLLAFLALVAAWSSIYLSSDDTAEAPDTAVAALPLATADGAIVAPDALAPVDDGIDPEMAADLAAMDQDLPTVPPSPLDALPETALAPADDPAQLPAPSVTLGTAGDASAPMAAEVAADSAPEPAAARAPATLAAAPAPAPAAPADLEARRLVVPGPEGQDEIFLAATDVPPPAFDAVALPLPMASADAAPAAPVPPPPAGEVYQFDADGRIVAGERGVVAPGGFWLIAARPAILPPPRPAGLAPAPEAAPADVAAAPADAPVADAPAEPAAGAFAPDATLAGNRPRPRPAGLVPPAPPAADAPVQAEDDASAAPPADPRFASVRPRLRPQTVVARAEEARRATEAASLAVAAATATPRGWDPNASPLAVPLSRRPAPRPADLSRVVEAAVAAAVRPAAAPPAAAVDPEEEDEPELTAAAPRIPTRASVAKQATFVNAINLSRLNLIGIYGTPSKRYALVRSSNGRYTRVEVGDRLDGGTVAAITASELRYQKGGRMLVLEMPRG